MVQQKKKSLIELLNSWRPFIEGIRGALKARDYRKETICGILRMLDAELSLWPGSIFHYIGGVIIGSGFQVGRTLIYGDIFRNFLERNLRTFKGSPLVVVQEYNKLVRTLFSEQTANKYLLEESLARRRLSPEEKILARGHRSMERLHSLVLQAQKQGAPLPVEEERIEVEEEPHELVFERKKALFPRKTSLDQRTVDILEKMYGSGIEIDDQLITMLISEADSLERFVQNAYIALPKSSLGSFQDLQRSMHELNSVLYFDLEEVMQLCKAADHERKILIEKKTRDLEKHFEEILSQATRLKNDIEEIEKELMRAKTLLEPFVKKKDTKERTEVLLNELRRLEINESLLTEKTSFIEKEVRERKQKVKELLTSFQNEFFDLLAHLQTLEAKADRIKLGILHARWEIFSKHTPFADLNPLVERVKESILETLSQCDEELIIGQKSFDEIHSEMLDSLYTHNVKLVRWELLSRALRLKDIRLEVEKELFTLDRTIGLLKLCEEVPKSLLQERKWLYSFFKKLICPFEIFKDTCDPESINVIFRYFWLDLDRYRRGNENRLFFLQKVERQPVVVHAFKTTQEIMEKIDYGKSEDFALLPFIAACPYAKKEEFLHKLKNFGERKNQAERLARAVQAAKTFEPERIDALLEATTLLRLSENPFVSLEERYEQMERILEQIEEAIFCEIGFTDSKSRMEAGYTLDELIKETRNFLPIARAMIRKRLETEAREKNFVGKIASLLLEEIEKIPADDVFEAAKSISLLFFQYRLLQQAVNPHSFARPVLLLTLVRKVLSSLSKAVPKEKASKISELFTFSRQLFGLLFPKLLRNELLEFLKEFSKRAKGIAGDTQIPLLSELEEIEGEIETTISWEIPIVSFVPGDLQFFLE